MTHGRDRERGRQRLMDEQTDGQSLFEREALGSQHLILKSVLVTLATLSYYHFLLLHFSPPPLAEPAWAQQSQRGRRGGGGGCTIVVIASVKKLKGFRKSSSSISIHIPEPLSTARPQCDNLIKPVMGIRQPFPPKIRPIQ